MRKDEARRHASRDHAAFFSGGRRIKLFKSIQRLLYDIMARLLRWLRAATNCLLRVINLSACGSMEDLELASLLLSPGSIPEPLRNRLRRTRSYTGTDSIWIGTLMSISRTSDQRPLRILGWSSSSSGQTLHMATPSL